MLLSLTSFIGFLVIIFSIIIILVIWLFGPKNQSLSTMHSKCNRDNSCGGDLTCDIISHRCKKQLGGDCSSDVDCQTGLYCNNWKCSSHAGELNFDQISDINPVKSSLKNKVHWE